VGTSLNIPREIFLSAFAGDSIITALWMIINIIHGKLIGIGEVCKKDKKSFIQGMVASFDVSSLAIVVASAIGVVTFSSLLHQLVPFVPKIIWLSMIATGLTFLPWRDRFEGSYVIGSLLLSLFFFACGAISNIKALFNNGTLLLLFPTVIVAVHALVLFSMVRILNIDRKVALVTSQTLVGGPATALAVIQAVRWNNHFEAIVIGLLGYAIANYIGYFVAWIVVSV